MRVTLFIILVVLGVGTATAQKGRKFRDSQKISGLLELNPWAKNIESYCAQGSDYYTLTLSDSSRVVLEVRNDMFETLRPKINKPVILSGRYHTKRIVPSPDHNSQHPISTVEDGAFECRVFQVFKCLD